MNPFAIDPDGISEVGLRFDPRQHRLVNENLWLVAMRNKLNRPELQMYVHLVHKTNGQPHYVPFLWVVPPSPGFPGLMSEIDVIVGVPGNHNVKVPSVEALSQALDFTVNIHKRMLARNAEIKKREWEKVQADEEARKDLIKRLRAKGETDLAYKYESYMLPYAPNADDVGPEFRDYANWMSRGSKPTIVLP